jgi:hypothetical protein
MENWKELLMFGGFILFWILLQTVFLPKLGVPT